MYGSPRSPRVQGAQVLLSVRLDIRRIETIKDVPTRWQPDPVKVVKNKCSPRSAGRIRHHVRPGHQRKARCSTSGRARLHQEVGRVVHLRGEQLARAARTSRLFDGEPQLMAEVDERIREHLAAQNAVEAEEASAAFRLGVHLALDDQPITLSE